MGSIPGADFFCEPVESRELCVRGKHVGLSLVVLLACVSVQAGEIDLGACRAIEKISK